MQKRAYARKRAVQRKPPPSVERQEEMQNIQWDREILRIYCDASWDAHHHVIGVAAVFVFDGQIRAYSKKLNPIGTEHIEVEAVRFALKTLPVYLKSPIVVNHPESIIVYSDFREIHRFVQKPENIKIEYMDDEQQRYNPWYTAAHNAARKEIFLRPKSGKW